MVELIFTIILICSLIAIGAILFRKIPLLLELPETVPSPGGLRNIFLSLIRKIRDFAPFKDFSIEIFLQKILSKIRVLTLKTDNKTSSWLQRLRERSLKKKFDEDDNYWQKIRKSTKK